MAENKKHVYDESKIKTLSSLEHIRLRTGMYIGRIGDGSHYDDGCYILLKEVIDNAIDEFIMGYGKEVQIGIQDQTVSTVPRLLATALSAMFLMPWMLRHLAAFTIRLFSDFRTILQ